MKINELLEVLSNLTPEQRQQIIDRYKRELDNNQVNIAQIARDFNMSTSGITGILQRAKVFQQRQDQIPTTQSQKDLIIQKYKAQLETSKTNPNFKIDLMKIAKEMDIDYHKVYNTLKDEGLYTAQPQTARTLSDQDKKDIVKTYMLGKTPKSELARQYNISNKAIDYILSSAVVSNKITQDDLNNINSLWDKGRKGITPDDISQMVTMYASGQGPTSIAQKFGISAPTVSYYMSIQPNKENLRQQFITNRSLAAKPQAAMTKITTRAGIPGNQGQKADWGRGGYK